MSAEETEPGSGIRVANASVTYRNGHTALVDASFAIPTGSITALVGVNGAGKSTLFKAIMGFLPVSQGSVAVLGRPVRRALKEGLVAYVPQSEDVDWNFPVLVEDVVMMGRYGRMGPFRIARAADRAKVAEALDRVGMTDFARRQIGELSGGQKKRVFLARALAQDGQVILLDEPFTGVDVTTEDSIVALLKELRAEGRVMLVATHNLGSVPRFCDRAVLIDRTVLAAGPTGEVFTEDNLRRTFGGTLRRFSLRPDESEADRAQGPAASTRLYDDEHPLVLYDDDSENESPTR